MGKVAGVICTIIVGIIGIILKKSRKSTSEGSTQDEEQAGQADQSHIQAWSVPEREFLHKELKQSVPVVYEQSLSYVSLTRTIRLVTERQSLSSGETSFSLLIIIKEISLICLAEHFAYLIGINSNLLSSF